MVTRVCTEAVFSLALSGLLGFLLTLALTSLWIRLAHRKGITAPDAHKPGLPPVANLGGIAFTAAMILTLLLLVSLGSVNHRTAIALLAPLLLAFVIGLLDDLVDLRLWKVPLAALCGIPLLLLRLYIPRPLIPLVGATRVYIVYPIVLLIAYAVVVNATNMVDTHNGVLASQMVFSTLSMMTVYVGRHWQEWSHVLTDPVMSALVASLAAFAGFFVLNRYPARVFWGNCGSLAAGALILSLAVISRTEYVLLLSMIPTILHCFLVLSSIGGIAPGIEIKRARGHPLILVGDTLWPSLSRRVAYGLPRMILLLCGPMTERELVRVYYILFSISSALAIVAGLLL